MRFSHPPQPEIARRRAHTVAIASEYDRPGWFTKHVFNRLVGLLTRAGIGVAGSRVLEVRGRNFGQAHRTPVNLLALDGERYLVAPRGDTQWARNLRALGQGRLLAGAGSAAEVAGISSGWPSSASRCASTVTSAIES